MIATFFYMRKIEFLFTIIVLNALKNQSYFKILPWYLFNDNGKIGRNFH